MRKPIWRGVVAILVATAAGCLYCAVNAAETTPFGLLVNAFVAPSVILFLVLEIACSARVLKYVGFFVPAIVIIGGCSYAVWSLRAEAVQRGNSDGGDLLLVYFIECYAVSLCFAFASLLIEWKRSRRIVG